MTPDWGHSSKVMERKIFDQLLMDRLTNRTVTSEGRTIRLATLSVDQIAVLSREMARVTVQKESNRRSRDPAPQRGRAAAAKGMIV